MVNNFYAGKDERSSIAKRIQQAYDALNNSKHIPEIEKSSYSKNLKKMQRTLISGELTQWQVLHFDKIQNELIPIEKWLIAKS